MHFFWISFTIVCGLLSSKRCQVKSEEGAKVIVIGDDRPQEKSTPTGWPLIINTDDIGNEESPEKGKPKGLENGDGSTIIILGGDQKSGAAGGGGQSVSRKCCDCNTGEPIESSSSSAMPIIVKANSGKTKKSMWKRKKKSSSTIILLKSGSSGTSREAGPCCPCGRMNMQMSHQLNQIAQMNQKPSVLPVLVPVTRRRRRKGKCKGQKVIVKKIIQKPVKIIRQVVAADETGTAFNEASQSNNAEQVYVEESVSDSPESVVTQEIVYPTTVISRPPTMIRPQTVIRSPTQMPMPNAWGTVIRREMVSNSASNPLPSYLNLDRNKQDALFTILLWKLQKEQQLQQQHQQQQQQRMVSKMDKGPGFENLLKHRGGIFPN